ncbi:MAG: YeeE/YedE family protein, partial [Thiomonas arsenitoxydans]|nr:YeeE/YedE family protein [Thiomonas arsenitoxydans]
MKTLAFLSGIVFGIGLLVSGMTDPAKVIAFLDIAGPWDPSLILVMVTAVVVALVPMQLAQRRARSLVGEKIAFPSTRGITGKLILGSAIF